MHKYLSIPELRYGGRLKSITNIDLIPITNGNRYIYKWNILDSKVYFWNTRFDFVELNPTMNIFYDGLTIEFEVTKNGELIDVKNFESLKDSLYFRYQAFIEKDSVNRNLQIPDYEGEIDLELFDYVYKSSVNEKVFMDLHFPEVLQYFQINNKLLNLYESNVEEVEMTFRKMGLFEIEMLKNTILVSDDINKSEVEIQFELTDEGCNYLKEQLIKRIKILDDFNIEKIENFECQRSRTIQNFKYDKSEQKIEAVYIKKTLTINDEPYYFWTDLKIK